VVADLAGVSKTTVSHVISGNRPVSAATRRKVERVMSELGFEPNYFARAMQSNRSNSVALIVQDLTNPYYPALARGLQGALAQQRDLDQHGHVVMLFDAGAGDVLVDVFVTEMIRRRVDGVVAAAALSADALSRLRAAGTVMVAVGAATRGSDIDWVSADDASIADDATTYLIDQGHTSIACIQGPRGSEPGASRARGWERAIRRAGLDGRPEYETTADWTTHGGAEAAAGLFALANRPSAVFCANDQMAIGALNAAISVGLAVPGDVALVGVDDIDAAALVRPALTTVHVPAEEIGRAAGELLARRLADRSPSPSRHVLISHELITRASA
jgi:DNA-binding LacI/PurR family transcriptional regulator